jgi:hypothetical protein
MVSPLVFDGLVWVGLLWLCLILLYGLWPYDRTATGQASPQAAKPTPKRTQAPKPFPGLIHQPHCDACAHAPEGSPHRPSAPPPRLSFTRGRRRTITLSQQFCPDPACAYYGWVGLGNLRSNGHPGGNPWRQLQCVACRGYFPETQGTPLQGKQVSAERLVWAVGAVAEGLGIRAVARVFAVDPNTVLQWLGEVAEHATTFSRYFLHDVRVT